ncbi:23S rRNA (guanosine(2251)-2'-O)-methyltransferase RlmB [Candidatus Berkiella aquae]|uniref:23S rRNA (Guanosine(2251)-2'-O)-methyltransferase RlmB n=1 Tax=Candidatus Berkiella aquae TaxID=295108 RepID=A0A0Q9YVC7_9GAMM|nr:23S rRNA (guanosine(2251)-2'-O)-methyltransferase RlmB [Candidatus Berkiella aquae]MCS5710185.1 23S rRNA (guanosine(2251)-2'-O)-methyltransferase RlmB [Candidatus Berkiella aquae]
MAQSKIIFGFHAVLSVLEHQAENVLNLYCQEKENDPRFKALIEQAKQHGIVVQMINKNKLDKLTDSTHHQGVMVQVRSKRELDEKAVYQWLEEYEGSAKPLLLLLEGIQDPHNLGACLRSAEALGVDWVILSKNNSAPLNATVSKVSCGADQSLSIVTVNNFSRFIKEIQDRGVWVIGTALNASERLDKLDLKRATALIMGTEETGLKQLTQSSCDHLAKIPLSGKTASLNVSVATGICLYECQRQRQ